MATMSELSKVTHAVESLKFQPQLVARSNLVKMTHLSNKEIIDRLESERKERLEMAGSNIKAEMLTASRCPLCTL